MNKSFKIWSIKQPQCRKCMAVQNIETFIGCSIYNPIKLQNACSLHLKGVLHLLYQVSLFCTLSQNNQHLENYHMNLTVNCSRNSKWHCNFSRPKLWIKTVTMLFGSITQELLGLPKFWCYFWVSWTNYYKMHISFFKKILIILRAGTKHANLGAGGSVPL